MIPIYQRATPDHLFYEALRKLDKRGVSDKDYSTETTYRQFKNRYEEQILKSKRLSVPKLGRLKCEKLDRN